MLVIANGSPVALQFRVHHMTTLACMWAAAAGDVSFELPLVMANTAVHFPMYWHIAGVWRCRTLVHGVQIFQLVLAMVLSGASLWRRFVASRPCSGLLSAEMFGLFLYLVYSALFVRDVIKARRKKEP